MFITNNHTSFHLWEKENLVQYQKVSKYCPITAEIKYAVILSSYFFIFIKNTMVIFYKSIFYDALVPIQCISVSWALAAHLVFSSYVCCLQKPFEAPKITESDE